MIRPIYELNEHPNIKYEMVKSESTEWLQKIFHRHSFSFLFFFLFCYFVLFVVFFSFLFCFYNLWLSKSGIVDEFCCVLSFFGQCQSLWISFSVACFSSHFYWFSFIYLFHWLLSGFIVFLSDIRIVSNVIGQMTCFLRMAASK